MTRDREKFAGVHQSGSDGAKFGQSSRGSKNIKVREKRQNQANYFFLFYDDIVHIVQHKMIEKMNNKNKK